MSQSAMDYIKGEIDRKLSEIESLEAKASEEGRTLAPEERERASAILDEVAERRKTLQDMEDNAKLRQQVDRIRGLQDAPAEEAPTGAKSLGDAFIKSDAYRGMKSGGMTGRWSSGPVEVDYNLLGKATVTTTASPIIQPDRQDGYLSVLYQRLTVADLLASGTTDSGTVRYLREATNTNAAAAVTEGDLKPESTITFDQVDEPVRKVATFLPVSDEMLEDESQIRSYLDSRLRLFVQIQEEAQLLNGTGTAPNLRGITARTGVQTASKGADSIADALYKAITGVRTVSFLEPDGIVMHPTNWQAVRLTKDANSQYYGGGPFTGAYGAGTIAPNNLWGLPVVVTTAIAVNTALVGAFRTAAQVFRRGGLTVEASNSHSDYFQRNLTAIRAEERLALAVYRPAAFYTVTALNV